MKRKKAKQIEEAVKPKAKGKVRDRISRMKKRARDGKEQEDIAVIDRERDTHPLAVPPVEVEGVKTDEVGIGWWEEEGPWRTNVFDDQEVSWGWGSSWLPFWDLDLSVEPWESLVADVVWDDHLWNFDVGDDPR